MNLPREIDIQTLEADRRKLEQNGLMLERIKKRVKELSEQLNQSTKESEKWNQQ